MPIKNPFPFVAAVLLSVSAIQAADWPQWQGPDRTRLSKETGLLKEWPASGPPVVWTATGLGSGYGSMAVAGDRVFVQGARGSTSVVIALNRADGKELWSKALGASEDATIGDRGRAARRPSTAIVCTCSPKAAIWRASKPMARWCGSAISSSDFGGSQLRWLISESPLVDGPHVVVSPGGPGAGMVKLDKMTGKTVWTSKDLSDAAGIRRSSPRTCKGVRTYMTFTAAAGVGVRASDGKLMFRYPKAANGTANIATPIFANDKVFFTSAYGTGGGLLNLTAQNGEVAAKEVYFTPNMKNHHGGVVLVDGYLYGFNDSILHCLEFATGKLVWRDRSVGKGSVTFADGNLYIQGENNVVGLAEATPSGYREKGRFDHSRQRPSELGAPRDQRGPAVRAQSGHAAGLRHQELARLRLRPTSMWLRLASHSVSLPALRAGETLEGRWKT